MQGGYIEACPKADSPEPALQLAPRKCGKPPRSKEDMKVIDSSRIPRLLAVLCMLAILGGCAAGPRDRGPEAAPGRPLLSEGVPGVENPQIKVIGIIGGVSWESSIEYYRLMNEMARERLGGLHSARILMYSIEFGDFAQQERLAEQGDWGPLRQTMVDAAKRLERGGADVIVIASNTLNSTSDIISEHVRVPVIHIADATAKKIVEKKLKKVALLGTSFTMEQDFYRDRLANYGIEVVTPDKKERDFINAVIFDELCVGVIKPDSRDEYVRIIERLAREEDAEGVILGCTEIPLLVQQEDVDVPVFDTTLIHSEAAVNYSLKDIPPR